MTDCYCEHCSSMDSYALASSKITAESPHWGFVAILVTLENFGCCTEPKSFIENYKSRNIFFRIV